MDRLRHLRKLQSTGISKSRSQIPLEEEPPSGFPQEDIRLIPHETANHTVRIVKQREPESALLDDPINDEPDGIQSALEAANQREGDSAFLQRGNSRGGEYDTPGRKRKRRDVPTS